MGGRGASSSKNKKLPNYKNAIIPKGKIGNYLVNPDNKNNQGKAVIFNKIGYNMKNKTKLEADLIKGLRKNNARLQKEDIHGKHYIVTMELGVNKKIEIDTVWLVNKKQTKFITAKPKERR